jgi:hypothetical protein
MFAADVEESEMHVLCITHFFHVLYSFQNYLTEEANVPELCIHLPNLPNALRKVRGADTLPVFSY